jgi:hypothetical protein
MIHIHIRNCTYLQGMWRTYVCACSLSFNIFACDRRFCEVNFNIFNFLVVDKVLSLNHEDSRRTFVSFI